MQDCQSLKQDKRSDNSKTGYSSGDAEKRMGDDNPKTYVFPAKQQV